MLGGTTQPQSGKSDLKQMFGFEALTLAPSIGVPERRRPGYSRHMTEAQQMVKNAGQPKAIVKRSEVANKKRTPRKSPTQSRSQDTVDVIIEAAGVVLGKYGKGGFSTNRIAKVAGVSVGSLYQYFPGKEAVFLAFLGKELKRDMMLLQAAIDRAIPMSFEDGVRVVLQQMIQMYSDRQSYIRLFFEELTGPRVESQTRARRQAEQALVMWVSAKSGKPPTPALERASFVATRAVLGVLLARYFENSPDGMDESELEHELHVMVMGCLSPHL